MSISDRVRSFRPLQCSVVAAALFLAGCTTGEDELSPDDLPSPESAKARLIELQHEVTQLIPREHLPENNMASADYSTSDRQFRCVPGQDERYSGNETALVQHSRLYSVRLEAGAPLQQTAEATYTSAAREFGIPGTDIDAKQTDSYYPPIMTSDGYLINVGVIGPVDAPEGNLIIDVWSPCFVEDESTRPTWMEE